SRKSRTTASGAFTFFTSLRRCSSQSSVSSASFQYLYRGRATPPHGNEVTMNTQGNYQKPYNLVLVISDQESFTLQAPKSYELAARAELRRRGTSFERHYIASAMCTPSRGVMFSGQPPQVNGVFDQMQLGYVPSLPMDRPSMGTLMSALGYETAYF